MSNPPAATPVQPSPAKKEGDADPQWWATFNSEFSKETDRAAVILTAAMLDDLLCEVLKAHLVPCATSSDALFDDATAPLANFSSRIEMAYRLGLITHRFARDLHLVRKIRNSFAHNVSGCHFNDMSVKSRVSALEHSMEISHCGIQIDQSFRSDSRTMFCFLCGFMLWQLHELKESLRCLDSSSAYDDKFPKGD